MNRLVPLLSMLLVPAAALAQIQVVGDEACPLYAVDIAAFATCEGDRVTKAAAATPMRVAAVPAQDVAPLKRSGTGLHVTAAEANRLLEQFADAVVLIDIRNPVEVAYSGQPDAVDIHVPYRVPAEPLHWSDSSRRIRTQRNAAFVDTVKAELARRDRGAEPLVLLLCRSGEVSAIAADALAAAGVPRVFTIVDGFEGDLGSSGRRDVNGWKNAGGNWHDRPLRLATAARR